MLAIAEQPAAYSENALAALWSRAHTLADALITQGGKRLRVLYPGRPSARAGPDFRDAVLLTDDGSAITGDIELHTTAPGWYSHGHHSDPNYNGVVLHVVFSPKGHTDTRQQSGMNAPILALEAAADSLDKASADAAPSLPALQALRDDTDIGAALDAAGDARFLAKSHGFTLDIRHDSADETLYRGIMDALGYASNRKPFRKLAQRVPYQTLAPLRDEPPATRLLAIKAMLLGASGLMRLANDSEDIAQLQRLYKRMPKPKRPLNKKDWHLFRVRPANHPVRRIIGAARILDDCLNDGIAAALANELLQGGAKSLTARLQHPPYIGNSRARDMLVNVALPFLHAHALSDGRNALAHAAQATYNTAPNLQDNEITREMRRLCNIGKETKMTARRQQGLIHLYKTAMLGQTYSSSLQRKEHPIA